MKLVVLSWHSQVCSRRGCSSLFLQEFVCCVQSNSFTSALILIKLSVPKWVINEGNRTGELKNSANMLCLVCCSLMFSVYPTCCVARPLDGVRQPSWAACSSVKGSIITLSLIRSLTACQLMVELLWCRFKLCGLDCSLGSLYRSSASDFE